MAEAHAMQYVRMILLALLIATSLAGCGKDNGDPLAPRNDSSSDAAPPVQLSAEQKAVIQRELESLITFTSEEEIQSALDKICAEIPADAEAVSLQEVNDGDTITLADGRRIRYIGIDAPEKNYATGYSAPHADEALKFNEKLLEGKTILLAYDQERYDKYERPLAYVFARPTSGEGKTIFVNAEMVRAGLARAYRYPPNLKYAPFMDALEESAASHKRGIWQDTPYGFAGNMKSRKFHRLTCSYGQSISKQNRIEFKTRRAALEAGYVPCEACQP
jgi:micrococcal nuclease